jgi:hypothetical protein
MPKMKSTARTGTRVVRRCVLLAVVASGSVNAAVNAADKAIARCATQDAKDARIACLETELRRTAGNDAPRTAPAMPVEPAARRSETPPVRAENSAPQTPHASAEGGDTERFAGPPDAGTSVTPHESRGSGIDELGAEQVARRSERGANAEGPIRASVVSVDFVGYRRLVVELDNGQIWRQTNGDRANVARELRNEQTFEVELRKTGLGGYRMHLVPLGRTIRVERLK